MLHTCILSTNVISYLYKDPLIQYSQRHNRINHCDRTYDYMYITHTGDTVIDISLILVILIYILCFVYIFKISLVFSVLRRVVQENCMSITQCL